MRNKSEVASTWSGADRVSVTVSRALRERLKLLALINHRTMGEQMDYLVKQATDGVRVARRQPSAEDRP